MASSLARLTELSERRVGTELRRGKYILDALIGVGSMGAVYRATHRNGSQAAVKVMHTELAGDDAIHARFVREGFICNQVNHPGLVKALDDDVDESGVTFLVMELLIGKTLQDESDHLGGKIPAVQLLHVVRELLGILVAVHAKGILHRDLKPENVFLTTSGGVKLLDLGVARLGASKFTAMGEMLGSPAYMAPEQAVGKVDEIDERSDLFSVGAILFALLSGRWVHEGATAAARVVAAATKPARPLVAVLPDANPALSGLVDTALRFDKRERWASADQMLRTLDGVLTAMIPRALQPRPTGSMAPMAASGTTLVGWPVPWSTRTKK